MANARFTVDGNVVGVKSTVRQSKTDKVRHPMTNVFDFAGVSQADILTLASNHLIVKVQDIWRKGDSGIRKSLANKRFSVLDDFVNADRKRGPVNPTRQARTGLSRMSVAEIREFGRDMGWTAEQVDRMIAKLGVK